MNPQMGGCAAIQYPRGDKLGGGFEQPGDDQRQGEVPPPLRSTPKAAHAREIFAPIYAWLPASRRQR